MTTAEGIGMGEKISNPFIHQGEALVCVGHGSRNTKLPGAEAYRLVPIDWYTERLTGQFFGSYAEKTADVEWARQDPNGFYHGMIVRYGAGILSCTGHRSPSCLGRWRSRGCLGKNEITSQSP
ncbi:MAG: hypothetical protein AAGH88_00305 [Planctomycetota bacterium]